MFSVKDYNNSLASFHQTAVYLPFDLFIFRYVKVHLIPLDASRACAFYCCTALEPQSQLSFNEGFRIPVPANALAVCALQLSICSLGPQAQEELLVRWKY